MANPVYLVDQSFIIQCITGALSRSDLPGPRAGRSTWGSFESADESTLGSPRAESADGSAWGSPRTQLEGETDFSGYDSS